MAFRLLSGEPVACEAEIGKLALVIAVTAPPQSNSECTILKEIESPMFVQNEGPETLLSHFPKYPEAQKMVKKRCFHRVSGSAVPFLIAPKELWHAGGRRGGSRRPGTTFVLGIGTRAACFMGCPTGGASKSAQSFHVVFKLW